MILYLVSYCQLLHAVYLEACIGSELHLQVETMILRLISQLEYNCIVDFQVANFVKKNYPSTISRSRGPCVILCRNIRLIARIIIQDVQKEICVL